MKSIRPFILFAVLCVNSSADGTEDNGREPHGDRHPVEMVLSPDFRIGDLRQMPGPATHPGLTFERRDYSGENAIEWQVRLQAPAVGEAPLYEDVKSADFVVQFPSQRSETLHWSKGSRADATDFQPRVEILSAGKPFTLESFGGRSSDGVMPYFNLATEGGGLVVAVGWSGDWRASFETLNDGQVRVTAGLKRSRFKLQGRGQVRLPSVLVMGYRGAWLDGQNQFRRLMLRHFTPKNHASMDLMPVAASVHGMFAFNATTEEKLTALAAHIAALKLPLDTFWLDAGWNEGGFPRGQGNPNADPDRFPHGLGPVGTAVSKSDMRLLVWFEPERAMRGTRLDRERPAWLLAPSGTPNELRYMEKDGFRLLDLGNAEARRWALDSISQHIREAGISVYRQDFNQYPAFFWHTGEPPDEVGLREVRYINGLYDFLDELARRHPGLILDNCASGGRRLDFEMMRRCVVLWRSDSCWDAKSFPRNVQAMTHGLSHWLPLHGLGARTTDDVALRSGMGACASFAVNFRDPKAVATIRKHLDRYLKVRPLFATDYYPLTEWSDNPEKWLAFQFHDPAKSEGIVQAFCGERTPRGIHTLKLHGLDPNKRYTITDWDDPAASAKRSGAELSNAGIEILADGVIRAVVLHYTSCP
ncbi:MAG: alpha-galactosidase [Pirellulaceae bacterium]|nr:alpha-galactosidase [Pirellulaceae bacterium]